MYENLDILISECKYRTALVSLEYQKINGTTQSPQSQYLLLVHRI